MPSIAYDLKYLQASLLDLEGYLLSDELYWPIGASAPAGDPPYPRLTLSGMLMSLKRLQGNRRASGNLAESERLEKKLDETRTKWRAAWSKKASREFSARLRLWRDYLEEYRKEPEANVDRYAYEVRRRAMLEILQPDAETVTPQELEMLDGLDRLLKSVFIPGTFVWDAEEAQAFPQDEFWYLYGTLKKD